jgi:hypothetical protein
MRPSDRRNSLRPDLHYNRIVASFCLPHDQELNPISHGSLCFSIVTLPRNPTRSEATTGVNDTLTTFLSPGMRILSREWCKIQFRMSPPHFMGVCLWRPWIGRNVLMTPALLIALEFSLSFNPFFCFDLSKLQY